jgi:hypothetical protein
MKVRRDMKKRDRKKNTNITLKGEILIGPEMEYKIDMSFQYSNILKPILFFFPSSLSLSVSLLNDFFSKRGTLYFLHLFH